MSRRTQQTQDEMRIRRWVRKILEEDKEGSSVILSEADLISTFVTPFTDVFNAAKVGSHLHRSTRANSPSRNEDHHELPRSI